MKKQINFKVVLFILTFFALIALIVGPMIGKGQERVMTPFTLTVSGSLNERGYGGELAKQFQKTFGGSRVDVASRGGYINVYAGFRNNGRRRLDSFGNQATAAVIKAAYRGLQVLNQKLTPTAIGKELGAEEISIARQATMRKWNFDGRNTVDTYFLDLKITIKDVTLTDPVFVHILNVPDYNAEVTSRWLVGIGDTSTTIEGVDDAIYLGDTNSYYAGVVWGVFVEHTQNSYGCIRGWIENPVAVNNASVQGSRITCDAKTTRSTPATPLQPPQTTTTQSHSCPGSTRWDESKKRCTRW